MDISKLKIEDQYLISYINLNLLRNEGKIDPNGLNELFRIASIEPRAQQLEIMYNNVLSKRATVDDYNRLYEKYKKELGDAVNGKQTVNNELLYYNSLLDYLNLEAKESNGPLSKEELEREKNYIGIVKEAKELEEAQRKLYSGEITLDDYKAIREKYKSIVLQKLKANGRNDDVTIQDGNLYNVPNKEIVKEETKKDPKILEEIKGMTRYFELEDKRDKEELSKKEEKEVYLLSIKYQNAMTLEEAHKRLSKNAIPVSVLNILKDKYRKELLDKINSQGLNPKDFINTEKKEEIKEEVKEEPIKNEILPKKYEEFSRYLSLVEKEELTKEEEKEFKLLKLKNQYAMTLEEAKKRVKEGTVPEAVYTTLYNKYKAELDNAIGDETVTKIEEVKKEEAITDIEKLKEENKLLKEKISNLENKLKAILEELK